MGLQATCGPRIASWWSSSGALESTIIAIMSVAFLRACGWSRQQPITRATQRDEAKITVWAEECCRRSKRADEEGATIVWEDESGFYLLPLAVRTWAPRGQTPMPLVPLTRDHLSAISAITLDRRLFLQMREDTYDGEAVVGFLRVVLRKIAGKVLLIWDGSPIHHGRAVKEFLSAGAANRLHLERLPTYAPDLNPDEGIWNYLKRVELGNVCATDLADLRHRVRRTR